LTDQRRARLLSALRRALPVLLTLGLIGLLLSQISPWDVVALLAHLSYPWVAAGVLCYVVTNAIRTLRFAALVRSRPIRLPRLLVTTFALSMFNNILPARSGELSFIYFMGRHHGVPAGEATATLIIARIFDYATVAALFVIVALASLARLPSYAARIISLVLFFLILSLAILVSLAWLGRRSLGLLRRLIGRLGLGERPLSASALRVGEGIACAFEAIPSSRTYLVVSLLSLLAWLGTFAWFACFLASMGVRTGLSQTIVGATFAVLSKALPFVTVGGLGTHEAGWTVGFMLVGFDKETAIATGFAVNILTLLSSLLFGLGGLGLWKWKGEGGKGKMERKNPLSIFPFPLSPLLAIFLALGVTYSVVNPLFEAPDEVWHTLYVKHLADGKGLPVHDLISEQPWRQEGSQPPLYYLAAALATAWVDTDDADAVIRYNPHAAIGLATAYGNKNVMAHTAWEAFPWRGTVLAAHLARLLSVLMGAGTVLCTYLLALEIFPGRRALAAGAAAINAFNPQFLFISAAINNDVAVTLFSSLALWLLVRTLRRGPSTSSGCHPSPRLLLALGIATGLAALSKLSGLGLLPLVATGLALLAWRRRSPRAFVVWSLLVFGVALAVAGWWYGRNWLLYRDPLGLPVMFAVMGRRAHPPSGLELVVEFVGVWKSFWAVFGWYNVLAEPWVYAVCNGLTLLGIAGLILLVVRRLRGTAVPALPELALLGLWTAIVLGSLVGWSQMRYPQGRLLFPAISAISILLFLGLAQWIPQRFTGRLAFAVGTGLLALALISPFRYIAPAYAPPPLLAPEEASSIPRPLDADFGGRLRLLGYGLDRDTVRPGETIHLTLYWQALAPMEVDYSVFVHLVGEDDLIVAQRDSYPGQGNLPTSGWSLGPIVEDVYPISIPPTALAPQACRLVVGAYDYRTMERLPLLDPEGRPKGDSLTLGWVTLLPVEGAVPNPVHFVLGNRVALIGFDLKPTTVRPGEVIHLTLYWQALAPVEEDYTVFTHLLGERDQIWAQKDSQPQGGESPTSGWEPGQVVEDRYELRVYPEAPPGVYDVEVGMYLAETGKRLPLAGGGNRILLGKVRVRPPLSPQRWGG